MGKLLRVCDGGRTEVVLGVVFEVSTNYLVRIKKWNILKFNDIKYTIEILFPNTNLLHR